MAKVMNVVFGIGIAILIFIVAILGINVFYPRPEVSDFGCNEIRFDKLSPCAENMTVGECKDYRSGQEPGVNTEYQECWDEYDVARDNYDRDFFLITATIGFIAIVSSMYMFSMINIAAGTTFSGLALIVFGFMVGWNSTDDWIKFLISLIITAVVVVFAVIVNKRYDTVNTDKKKKRAKKA
ncbi:MAG: hypothetical protein GOU98_04625 [Candidatus Altiarchaeota archaeon]|nr:hypothetical protein [Candidatus Altiarchaeota archaeon]